MWSGVALTKRRPHSTMLIWVQFLFKPNSLNVFFFTRLSTWELGSSLICQRTTGSVYSMKFQNPRTGCFQVFENHQNQIGWFLVFQNLQRTANFHERIPNSFLVLWLFEFFFWVDASSRGFHKMGIAGDMRIYISRLKTSKEPPTTGT